MRGLPLAKSKWGEISYNPFRQEDFFQDKPFVGYTETDSAHKRKGLALRRLEIMNVLAKALYGFPLHSGILGEDNDARKVWGKLVDKKRARKIEENELGRVRYVFAE